MFSTADSDIQFLNDGSTAFSRLFFGPLTAAWPALKVEQTNAPVLSLRNGADNNYTSLLASNVTATSYVIATNGVQSYGTNNLVEVDGLGTTITPALWLTNGTAAALGAQQVSPALMLGGHGYRSGNSTEMPVSMGWYVLPVQGSSANPYARIKTIYSISNAAPADVPNTFIDTTGDMRANSMYSYTSISGGASDFGSVTINNTANYYQWTTRSRMYSPADGDIQLENQATTAFSRLFLGPLTAAWPALKVESTNYPTLSLRNGADNNYTSLLASNVTATTYVAPTNGLIFQGKHSFTTNFTMLNSINIYECNGTNQTITMLDTTNSTPWQIYRFASTNGHGKFTLQTAQADQTIRDGASTTFVQVGIGSPSFYHDGKHWWSAARTRVVMPNACWSLTTNVLLTADVITNVPFNQLEFNNSQGIALVAPGQFYVTNAGQYMITFSAVINGGGNNTSISLWMRQSGVDIPRSRTRQVFTSATAQQCMTVNYIFNVTTNNTYFELYAGSHDTGAGIISEAANPTTYTAPAQPGVILTINKTSDTFP